MTEGQVKKRLAYFVPFVGFLGLALTGCVSNQGQAASGQLYEVYSPGSDVPHYVTADKVGGYASGQAQASMDQDDGSQDDQERHQRDVEQDLSNREFLRGQQGLQ